MKKIMSLLAVVLFFLAGCNTVDSSDGDYVVLENNQTISQNQLSASYPVPNNLNQIEQNSDLVIKGKVLGIQSFGEYIEGGDITSTLTEVDVLEVFDGDYNEGHLVVAEPYRLTDEGIEPVGHYIPLEPEEEYIFFLQDSGEDIWMLNYMGFGKYHPEKEVLNQSIQSFSTYEEIKAYDFLSDSEANKYSTIREDVLNVYGNQ